MLIVTPGLLVVFVLYSGVKIPDTFSPTTKFFDVDGLPVAWDIEGSPPVPLIATVLGELKPMADSGRVLNDGVEIDEDSFRAMLNE
jgi:hypothetical protein